MAQSQILDRFIETGDLRLLGDRGITFQKDENFKSYLNLTAQLTNCATMCTVWIVIPIGMCCPSITYDKFDLQLTADSIIYKAAANDCCFHIATTQKTVPLDKVQDVELNTNCVLSCCGLKAVDVQTAGQGSGIPEVSAAFVKDPDRCREAIRLAVKKFREQTLTPPGLQAMGAAPRGDLRGRLTNLDVLVSKGVLSAPDAQSIRVSVLAAEADPTARLIEALDLSEQGLISRDELAQLARMVVKAHTR